MLFEEGIILVSTIASQIVENRCIGFVEHVTKALVL